MPRLKIVYTVLKPFYPLFRSLLAELFGPQIITVELSNKCNLRCEMCEISYWDEKPKDVSLGEFKLIYSKLSFFQKLLPSKLVFSLSGIGEILLNKDVFKIIEFVKSKGCLVTFADNFTLLNEQNAKLLVELQVDEVFLSLDGATKETFESIRKGASFEIVIANARRLVKLKCETHSEKPRIIVRMVVSKKNVKEMPLLVRLASEIGLKEIAFSGLIISEETSKLKVGQNEFKEQKKKALAIAEKLGLKLFFPEEKKPVACCNRFENEFFINPFGFVMPCHSFTQGNRYSESIKKHTFGNIFEQDLFSIWNSKKYASFRKTIRHGKVPELCKDCQWFGK